MKHAGLKRRNAIYGKAALAQMKMGLGMNLVSKVVDTADK